MKRNLVPIVIAIAFLVGAAALSAQGQRRSFATPTLNDSAKAALIAALAGPDGEYAARAEYEAILDKFGSGVLPYAHIIQAEEKHIAALKQQCRNFGVPIPSDEYLGKVKAPESLADAAKAGILAEEANVKMYEGLLKTVQSDSALVRVFTRLQSASLNHHLPALKAAGANGGTVTSDVCNQTGCQRPQRGGGCQQMGADCPQQGARCQPMGPGGRQQGRAGVRP